MALSVDNIVTVSVTTTSSVVSRAGFGVALILGSNAAGNYDAGEYVRSYTSTADMLTDGFLVTDAEYLAAVAYFSQDNKPTQVKIGVSNPVATVKEVTYTGTLTAGSVSAVVNGTTYTEAFASDQATTMAALATAIQADTYVATATWTDGTQVLEITSTAGEDVSIGTLGLGTGFSAAAVTLGTQPTSTIATDMAAIVAQDQDFYGIYLAEASVADAYAAMAYAEQGRYLCGVSCWDAQALTATDATSLAYYANSQNYDNTFVVYNGNREHVAAAIMGDRFPTDPGSATWKFKDLSGITADPLSQTQANNLDGVKCNYYTTFGSNSIFAEGTVASGEFVDIIRGIHWTESRIQENTLAALVANEKIPYTDVGFQIIANVVRAVLREGIANDLFVDDENLSVTVPKKADISAANITARNLPDVTFYATLAGAVHSVAISGTVSA